ncbi:hypothetical protein Tco_0596642, partial [Tanacetum coccineum]
SNSQLNDKGFVDSGSSRHMTGNIAHISDFKDFNGGYITFGGGAYGGKITGKCIQGVSESSTSSQQDQDNQDCIIIPILKDASYFGNVAPRYVVDAQIQDKDGLHDENDATEKSHDDSSLKDNGTAINIATPEINTGSREVNTASYFYPSYIHSRSYPTRLLTFVFMANLEFCDKHNMVAFLEKSTGSAGFHQIIDFLNRSHICYALTKKPDVYISFIKQFWRSAEGTLLDKMEEVKITATIDGHSMTITEGSLRRHLKLDDQDGLSSIPNSEIFEQLALMGYHTDSDKLTFQKGAFSPQWRFLIHSILHCLSPRRPDWEQLVGLLQMLVICLATNRKYNFSRMIFEHMVSNISSPHSNKVFNNMKRPTKGFSGQEVSLFPTMLAVTEPSTSPSRITSSPSHSPEPLPSPTHSHSPALSTTHEHTTAALTQPSPTQPSPGVEHYLPTPNDHPIIQVKKAVRKGSAEVVSAACKKGTDSEDVPIVSTAEDVEELHRLVKERYSTSRPEGYDLMLWGDLHTLFEPDEEDELWKNQHEYNVIKKKYPLKSRDDFPDVEKKLEGDHGESSVV